MEALVKEHGKAPTSKLDHSSMESTKPYSKLSTEELNRLVSVHADVEQHVSQSTRYQLIDVLKTHLASMRDSVSTEMSEREEQRLIKEGHEGEAGGGDAIEGLSWGRGFVANGIVVGVAKPRQVMAGLSRDLD